MNLTTKDYNFLSISQVAKMIKVHRSTVWRMYKRNELNALIISDNSDILIIDDEKLTASKKKAAAGGFKPKRKKS